MHLPLPISKEYKNGSGLVLFSVQRIKRLQRHMNVFVGVCTCLSVPACLYNFCVISWKKYMQFHGQKSWSQTETIILSCWVDILHVVMRLIGPSPICSGSLPSPRLLKLTIILPNLACVTAEDKCAMPSPPAARETLSHFKCQSMLFNTPKRFNIDRLKNIDGLGFIWL